MIVDDVRHLCEQGDVDLEFKGAEFLPGAGIRFPNDRNNTDQPRQTSQELQLFLTKQSLNLITLKVFNNDFSRDLKILTT